MRTQLLLNRIKAAMIMTMLFLCVVGCGKKEKAAPENSKSNGGTTAIEIPEETPVTSFFDNYSCFSSLGLTEVNDNGFLCHTVMETGEVTYKCSIDGCKHEASADKTRCEAYVPENLIGVLVDSDHIYLYGWSDESGDFVLYRENIDGSGREFVSETDEITSTSYDLRFAAAAKTGLVIGFCSTDTEGGVESGLIAVDKADFDISVEYFDEFGTFDTMSLYGNTVLCRIGETNIIGYDTSAGTLTGTKLGVSYEEFVCDAFMASVDDETGEIIISCQTTTEDLLTRIELCDTKYGARYYPKAFIDGKLLVEKKGEGDTSVWKSVDLLTGEEEIIGCDSIDIIFCDGVYLYGYTIDNMLFKRPLEHLCTFWPSADDVSSYEYEIYGSDTVVIGVIDIAEGQSERYELLSEGLTDQLSSMGEDYSVAIKCIKMSDWISSGLSYKEYVERYYPDVDILKVPYKDPYQAIKDGAFISLNEYLLGEEGSALYSAMPEIRWKECGYNGLVYSVPNTALSDYGEYLLFNKKYFSQESVNGWDGTYEGLESIIEGTKVAESQYAYIAFYTLTEGFENGRYENGLYIDEENGTVVPWYETDGLREYYGFLNRLYLSGCLGETSMYDGNELASDYYNGFLRLMEEQGDSFEFGIIAGSSGSFPDLIGQYDYILMQMEHYVGSKMNQSMGIYSGTDCKENALELLKYMYTDKDMINLFVYGDNYDSESQTVAGSVDAGDSWIQGLNFGNWAMAISVENEDEDARYRQMWECAEKYSREGAFIGKAFDFSGYEDVGTELEALRIEYIDIWKSDDFDAAWDKMMEDVADERYSEYAEAVLNSAS